VVVNDAVSQGNRRSRAEVGQLHRVFYLRLG
jgi:hypothetical protein